MNCLGRILDVSLKDRVADVDILSQCHVPYAEVQLKSKRLRWYGHVCRQADDRLAECMLFGQVRGPGHAGKPGKLRSDMVLSDMHHLPSFRPYQITQTKSAWQAPTCFTHTHCLDDLVLSLLAALHRQSLAYWCIAHSAEPSNTHSSPSRL